MVDKSALAGVLGRHARCAELSERAVVQAQALFGHDSLVVVRLWTNAFVSMHGLTTVDGTFQESASFVCVVANADAIPWQRSRSPGVLWTCFVL